MAILLKVQWVDKSNEDGSFQCVRNIGGSTRELHWKHSQDEAIRAIEEGAFAYYVETGAAMSELQVGVGSDGRKYLKLKADVDQPPHLASLPPFPIDPPATRARLR